MESLPKQVNWDAYTLPTNEDLDVLENIFCSEKKRKKPKTHKGCVCVTLQLLGFESASSAGYPETRQRMREIIAANPDIRITPLMLIDMLNKEGLIRASNPYYAK